MEEFKQRLLLYVENLGKSVRAFESECGLGNGTIASIRAKGPGAEVVSKIAYAHPDLDLNWLFRGEGKMLLTGTTPSDTSETKIDVHHNTVNIGNVSEFRDLFRDVLTEIMKGK